MRRRALLTPRAALTAYERGDLPLVLPTHTQLVQLTPFASAGELVSHAQGRDVEPVQPRIVRTAASTLILLPAELDEATS